MIASPSVSVPLVTPFETYLILQLDDISGGLGIMLFILGVVIVGISAVYLVVSSDFFSDERKVADRIRISKTALKYLSLCFFSIFLIKIFLPSTKTMAAVYLLPPIVNNQEVQKLPEEILDLLRGLIREWTPSQGQEI